MNPCNNKRIIVCVGTGGVGKTTISAVLALAGCMQGRKTLVMTIDPAKRLCQALGLPDTKSSYNKPIGIDLKKLFNIETQGFLDVMMLDVKYTFDTLVRRFATNDTQAHLILNNPIYQHFSASLAGSHEYAAVEKLYEMATQNNYDLIVLDTPPCEHVVAFLEAPDRIVDFLDQETLRWFVKSTKVASKISAKLFDLSNHFFLKIIGKVAGAETLLSLIDFLHAFEGMYEGFKNRSQVVKHILQSQELAYVLITAPHQDQLEHMLSFKQQLQHMGYQAHAAILNRVQHTTHKHQDDAICMQQLRDCTKDCSAQAQQQAYTILQEELAIQHQNSNIEDQLQQQLQDLAVFVLPNLPPYTESRDGLMQLKDHLLQQYASIP